MDVKMSENINTVLTTVIAVEKTLTPICTLLARFFPALAPAIALGLTVLRTVSLIAQVALVALGIFKSGEQIGGLGDQAIQAAEQGITPAQFDRYGDYLAEIRQFEVDPQKSAATPEVEKLATGLAIAAQALERQFNAPEGTGGRVWQMVASNPDYFNADRLSAMLADKPDLAALPDYFAGKLGPAEALNTEKELVSREKALHPAKEEPSIYAELDAAREKMQQFLKDRE